ncbi:MULTISPECIES: transposase [Pseudomonas]|uniref:transposase n=1 Tax=Pseudomonas TaxID=286 RepID=UPI001E28E5DC|nr:MULTISPECIES: transposase [Pseudomonas]
MARLPRLYFPGCVQHVIQRGNNREACFYDEADYKVYLSFLNDAAKKYQVAIHAFVLMTNHVHLLATPQKRGHPLAGLASRLKATRSAFKSRVFQRRT